MIAEPHGTKCRARGDGQHGLRVVRMQRRHIARKLGVARQGHIVSELHRETVTVAHHPIRHARRRIEHDAPEIGMAAGADGHRHRIICQGGRDQ